MEKKLSGLSSQEVLERRNQGEGEGKPAGITKSRMQIVKENTVTLFNALNFYSGSFVISGKADAKVVHVGNDNYAS